MKSWFAFSIEAANQPIAWQQRCILDCRLGEVDLCRRKNWGRNSKFSTSTWIWVWSWMVLMGFAAQFHTRLTQQYSEVTPLPLPLPPSPGAVMENISTPTCGWKACVYHAGRDWRSDFCFTLEQTVPSSYLTRLTISEFMLLFFFFLCTTTLKGFVGRLDSRLNTSREDDVGMKWNLIN